MRGMGDDAGEAGDEMMKDPFVEMREKGEVPEGHLPAMCTTVPGATVTTIEVPANLNKERGFACFLHACACADGIIVLRPSGEGFWDRDDYITKAECYAEVYELFDSRPMMTINIAKGRIRSGLMMMPAMSTISLATPDATFGFPEVRVGAIPSVTAVAMRRRVTDQTMRRMMLLGDSIDASEAQRVGLVDFVGDVEVELARLLHQRCAPKAMLTFYKPDVVQALEAEQASTAEE